jgi:hypothetical protein
MCLAHKEPHQSCVPATHSRDTEAFCVDKHSASHNAHVKTHVLVHPFRHQWPWESRSQASHSVQVCSLERRPSGTCVRSPTRFRRSDKDAEFRQIWQNLADSGSNEYFAESWQISGVRLALEKGRVTATSHVLIQAGAGGVGSFAIQLAKARGARVVTTCSTRNVEFCKVLSQPALLGKFSSTRCCQDICHLRCEVLLGSFFLLVCCHAEVFFWGSEGVCLGAKFRSGDAPLVGHHKPRCIIAR